jgi:hypothetical protein
VAPILPWARLQPALVQPDFRAGILGREGQMPVILIQFSRELVLLAGTAVSRGMSGSTSRDACSRS